MGEGVVGTGVVATGVVLVGVVVPGVVTTGVVSAGVVTLGVVSSGVVSRGVEPCSCPAAVVGSFANVEAHPANRHIITHIITILFIFSTHLSLFFLH